jgi:hypothetical protein
MVQAKIERDVKTYGGLYAKLKKDDVVTIIFYPPYNNNCRVIFDDMVFTISKNAFNSETIATCEREVNRANNDMYSRRQYSVEPPFPDRIKKDKEELKKFLNAV